MEIQYIAHRPCIQRFSYLLTSRTLRLLIDSPRALYGAVRRWSGPEKCPPRRSEYLSRDAVAPTLHPELTLVHSVNFAASTHESRVI
jgi:hypothetical protein